MEDGLAAKQAARGVNRADAPREQKQRPSRAAAPYHHGALREALLKAAERILRREGIQGLTLRATARHAGVSHAAPKNHFGDLAGLLSDLAAVGFERLGTAMMANAQRVDAEPGARKSAIGRGYVDFARANPGLFLLMFRSERLDFTRPALRAASKAAFGVLSGSANGNKQESSAETFALLQAAQIAGAWSFVHGLAMLLIDGRLKPLIGRLPVGTGETELLAAIFRGSKEKE
jgi:AcrR family transcriptional regulator